MPRFLPDQPFQDGGLPGGHTLKAEGVSTLIPIAARVQGRKCAYFSSLFASRKLWHYDFRQSANNASESIGYTHERISRNPQRKRVFCRVSLELLTLIVVCPKLREIV